MALIIPKEYVPVMNKIRNLPDSSVEELVQASVVTSKPAIGGRVKTGQWEAIRD
jgi:hypothetical protein